MSKTLNLTLQVWRQPGSDAAGTFETYAADGISDDASFLEMLDIVNERLIEDGKVPIEFPHDCREGICGTCGVMINGRAHGHEKGTATCQLHMRKFNDGDTIVIEPWRAAAFPVVRDLVVDRSPLDAIVAAGGFITAPTGTSGDANDSLIPKRSQIQPWTPQHASGVLPVLLRVPTLLASCSPRPRCGTSTRSPRVSPSGTSAQRQWSKPWSSSLDLAPITASAMTRAPKRSASTSSPT